MPPDRNVMSAPTVIGQGYFLTMGQARSSLSFTAVHVSRHLRCRAGAAERCKQPPEAEPPRSGARFCRDRERPRLLAASDRHGRGSV